jgi:hypothetical protein
MEKSSIEMLKEYRLKFKELTGKDSAVTEDMIIEADKLSINFDCLTYLDQDQDIVIDGDDQDFVYESPYII